MICTARYGGEADCQQELNNPLDCAADNGHMSDWCVCGRGDPDPDPDPDIDPSRFHHTTTGSSDGGKSLVMCPGQTVNFDSCDVGGVNIPFHGYDDGRETYWNMFQVPIGDIVCVKDGMSYTYRADEVIVFGQCN